MAIGTSQSTPASNKPKFALQIENGNLVMNDGSIGSKLQTNKYTPNLYSPTLSKTKSSLSDFSQKSTVEPTTTSFISNIPKNQIEQQPTLQQEKPVETQKGRGPTNLFTNEKQALDKMLNAGINEEKALEAIKLKRQEKWGTTKLTPQESKALITMANADIDINEAIKAVKEKRYDDMGLLSKIGKNVLDLATTGPLLVSEQVANVGSFLFDNDELRQQAQDLKKMRKENFEYTTGGKAGSFITGAGETLAVGPTKVSPTMLGRMGQGALLGGTLGGADPVLSEGKDATMGDIAMGGTIGAVGGAVATPLLEKVAIPAVGGLVSKSLKYGTAGLKGGVSGLGKSIGRDIKSGIIKPFQKSAQDKAGSIALGGIINPAKLDAVKKGLMVDEGVATPQDVGKWMLDRVKPGNKQEIAEQLIKHSNKSKKSVDEALKKIPDTFENESAKKALVQITQDLEGRVGFEDDVSRITKLLGKDKYTLTELNAVKREMDNIYNIYKKSGEVSASLNAQGLNKVRQDIRRFIENEAKKYGVDIKKLNNETSVSRGLAEGIMKKDNADSVREMLSAFAPSGIGSVVGAGQSIAQGNDPLIVLRDALIGGATAKILTSTKVRTMIADKLNKLGPKELSALEKYIKSGGADEVGKKVAEKIIPQKLLPPAGGSSYKSPSIITPQTIEKGIIQESKLPLKNTKYGTNNINSGNGNNSSVLLKPKGNLTPLNKKIESIKNNKSGFINPGKILEDTKNAGKTIKKVLTTKYPDKSYNNKKAFIGNDGIKELNKNADKIVPLENAIKTINNEIPNNIRQGWFLNGDKNYKSKLVDVINSNNNIKKSGLRIMYDNYIYSTKNPLPFSKFINTPIEMYRGSTTGKFNNDIFSSYSLNKKVAEEFSRTKYGEIVNPKNIDTIKVKPIDTLGSYQTTGEAEVLVLNKKG